MNEYSRELSELISDGSPLEIRFAYALLHNYSSEPTILVWGDKDRSFSLTGKLSLAELTKIAKSFK